MAVADRWRWLGWVLGLAALALVGWQLWLHRDHVAQAWSGLDTWRLLAAMLLGLLAQFFFALAWCRLIRTGGSGPTLRMDLSRWLLTLAGKYLPGKIWQGVGRVAMYSGELPAQRVGAVYVREMLLSISVACTLGAVHGIAYASLLGPLAWGLLPAALALALLAHPALSLHLRACLPKRLHAAGADGAPSGRQLASAWLLQLAGYLCLGLALVLIADGVVETTPEIAAAIVSGLCLAGIAGIAALVVPAGLGVREAMLAAYLAQYMNLGEASLLALLARGWLTLAEAAAIGIGLALAAPRRAA